MTGFTRQIRSQFIFKNLCFVRYTRMKRSSLKAKLYSKILFIRRCGRVRKKRIINRFSPLLLGIHIRTYVHRILNGMQCSRARKGEELQFRCSFFFLPSPSLFPPSQIQILFFEADMQMKRN